MDFFGMLMWPIKWVLEAVLVGFHWLFEWFGMDPASGLVWVLSIASLVLVVRTAMIPLTVKQIKSSRKALEVAPEVKKIQDKYKGKKDSLSREAMNREVMEVYKKAGTNPLASCLPLLVQMPVFLGLVQVLNTANQGAAGVGAMSEVLARQFRASTLFDAVPLHMSLEVGVSEWNWPVIITAVSMTIFMVGAQFYTQLQIMTKNQTPQMKESPMYKQQRMMLYIIPFFLLITAWIFPLATMFYWLVSNVYTLVQQLIIINRMPNPGSEAALSREAKMARKRQRMGLPAVEGEEKQDEEDTVIENLQRKQPRKKGPRSNR
ncbi:membrane protein insertase YidC [Agrococcus casei]|uniref:membrane protein insertase YidC n=1 Tax=Agrococcus casei TaxID=343512 RepID=UPI003F91859D